jgi:hypothetical protein
MGKLGHGLLKKWNLSISVFPEREELRTSFRQIPVI